MTRPDDTQPGKPQRPRQDGPEGQPPAVHVGGSVGGDFAAGDLNKTLHAGRDIVGRDVVTTTTTTNVGFGIEAVQRLVITIGLLVFVTAACFFAGGAAVGGAAIAALNRSVGSNTQSAAEFEAALAQLQRLPAGTAFSFPFTEEQISSYFRLTLVPERPELGISDGKVRLLDAGDVVVGGRAERLGRMAFAATFEWQTTPGRPLALKAVALQVLPLGNSRLGWIPVPAGLLGNVENSVNALFGNVQLTAVSHDAHTGVWTVRGITR
jgi:hypothetical protein